MLISLSVFLLSAYLLVAEAASFDKKELCRSDTKRLDVIGSFDVMNSRFEAFFPFRCIASLHLMV
jgi:hypothetical protein